MILSLKQANLYIFNTSEIIASSSVQYIPWPAQICWDLSDTRLLTLTTASAELQ